MDPLKRTRPWKHWTKPKPDSRSATIPAWKPSSTRLSISTNTRSSASGRRSRRGTASGVNADSYVVRDPTPTGLEVLTVAGLLPAKDYTLRVKFAGERPRKVGLDEKIDLRRPGVEKFKALPRDQTEG